MGYKTKIIEFIANEHTPKNLLIIAVKKSGNKNVTPNLEIMQEVQRLKKMYGLDKHYLEELISDIS